MGGRPEDVCVGVMVSMNLCFFVEKKLEFAPNVFRGRDNCL